MAGIGEIICAEREKRQISQEQLFRGICLQGDISKIESGKRIPDKLMVDALFQRLGRCADTLEAVMTKEEYELFDMRECLQRSFYKQDYAENKRLLVKYKKHKAAGQPLHRQFLLKYGALNEYLRDKDGEQCKKGLEGALRVTFPEGRQAGLEKYYLCSQELHLLILIGYFGLELKQAYALPLLWETADYIETRYYEEEKVKLFPQCMWLLARYYQKRGEWKAALECSGRGLACLNRNGALPLLANLQELKLACSEKLGIVPPELYCGLDALKDLLRSYGGWILEMDELSLLNYFYHEDEIGLAGEILRGIRQNRGIAQGALESCSQAALSRIESGRHSPGYKHFRMIAKELGVDKDYYISRVQSENYDLYELAHWRNRAVFCGDWEKEAVLLDRLAAALDMRIPINKQYIETCRFEERRHRGEMNPGEEIQRLTEILRYTMPDYREGKLRIPSRHEFSILAMMTGLMRKAGRMEDSLKLMEQLLSVFEKSKVREDYHTNSMLLLYRNYGELLEVMEQLELAEEIDIRGIQLAIRCGQVDILGQFLANLACVHEKNPDTEKQALCKRELQNAYRICRLCKQDRHAQEIQKYYEKTFGEKITDACRRSHCRCQKYQHRIAASERPAPQAGPAEEQKT